MIIYTLFCLFLCNTEKRLALDWALTSFLRNILIKLQDIHVKVHYNTYTHFYTFLRLMTDEENDDDNNNDLVVAG